MTSLFPAALRPRRLRRRGRGAASLPALPALFALLSVGCQVENQTTPASVAADSGEVAFELAGAGEAAILIPVHINGEGPFSFVLDTGATLTCIASTLQERLRLPDWSGGRGFGAGVGGSGQVQLVQADSVRVGPARQEEQTLCVIDLASLETTGIEVDGLLGLSFLRAYRVGLDFDRNVATFE